MNALQAAAGPTRFGHIRVLEKMLTRLSENVSYGIPIGPPASRVLGEAVLVDVDSTLEFLVANGRRVSSSRSMCTRTFIGREPFNAP